jgi:hypothetical protein
MSLYFLIGYILILAILFVAGWLLFGNMRTKGSIARALNMSLFLVTLPRDNPSNQSQKPEKELISVMEQFYASLMSLHAKGWNKFLYGEPYIALEMAVHHTGEQIHFYVSSPRSYEDILEKQIHAMFPSAEIQKTQDYNIFNPHGVTLGAYLKLKQNQILPLRTYQYLETDPLGGFVSSLAKLERDGEGAAVQILIRPSHKESVRVLAQKVAKEMQSGYKFSEALSRALKPPKKEELDPNKPHSPKVMTPFEAEVVKAMQSKAGKPLFDTNIRVVVSSDSKLRSEQLLNDVTSSFVQFGAQDLNTFEISRATSRALQNLIFNYSFRLFDNSKVMLLSNEELTSVYHFPMSYMPAPKVKFIKSRQSEPPSDLPEKGISLGVNTFRGQERLVRMTDADRARHLYIIGQTGTGKSTLMKSMIRQDLENGKGICLIDPHGEFAEFALSVVPKDRIDDVIYFDPADIARPMGLNMLEIDPKHPEQKTMVIDELFGIFDKLYDLKTTGGPMFEKYFKNSALLLLDDYEHEIPVLADISRVLVDSKFRADKLSREKNPLVSEFWKLEAEKAGGDASLANMAPYISSKITAFVYNEFLRPIINQKKSAFNFREAMDSRKILIVNLSKGRIGDLNANLLGMVIVGKLLMAALSRVDIDESLRKDFYLYIDEFQNFTTDAIGVILSEARKYHLELIVAHQFIKQLKENIRDAVFGNIGSIAAFRIGPDDAEFMKNKFDPIFTPQDLMNIDNLNAYLSLLINGQTSRPFNIKLETDKVFGVGDKQLADSLKELSRLKFGRPREEVEQEIREKYNTPNIPVAPAPGATRL